MTNQWENVSHIHKQTFWIILVKYLWLSCCYSNITFLELRSFYLWHFLWANKTNNKIKQEINISWQHLTLVKFTNNKISCYCPWLGGWHQLICLRLSITILHSWTFITKPMSNMKPEITIYWRYDKLTDEQIKFSAWLFDMKWQPFTNFLEHHDMLALYMSSFTSFSAKYYVLSPLGSCLWHFTHTVLLFLYKKSIIF